MATKYMNNIQSLERVNDLINAPAHYIEGRSIEPIEVIEAYCVCPHLAAVIKYLARCNRKGTFVNDLLKARWYLRRELKQLVGKIPCQNPLLQQLPVPGIEDILMDWKLPNKHLEKALSFVLLSRVVDHSQRLTNEDIKHLTKHEITEIMMQNHYETTIHPIIKAIQLINKTLQENGVGTELAADQGNNTPSDNTNSIDCNIIQFTKLVEKENTHGL